MPHGGLWGDRIEERLLSQANGSNGSNWSNGWLKGYVCGCAARVCECDYTRRSSLGTSNHYEAHTLISFDRPISLLVSSWLRRWVGRLWSMTNPNPNPNPNPRWVVRLWSMTTNKSTTKTTETTETTETETDAKGSIKGEHARGKERDS